MRTNDNPPKTYLTESILVTLFCCLPFGIVGIVNASKVCDLIAKGDLEGAKKASEEAEAWSDRGIVSGVVLIVLSGIIAIVVQL